MGNWHTVNCPVFWLKKWVLLLGVFSCHWIFHSDYDGVKFSELNGSLYDFYDWPYMMVHFNSSFMLFILT
jgi:hypothetical protein